MEFLEFVGFFVYNQWDYVYNWWDSVAGIFWWVCGIKIIAWDLWDCHLGLVINVANPKGLDFSEIPQKCSSFCGICGIFCDSWDFPKIPRDHPRGIIIGFLQ